MCGIYCSKDYKTFKELHLLNTQRGDFATGHIFLKNDGEYEIGRFPGRNNYDINPTEDQASKYDLFLGHTQSPTGVVREFKDNTSHPFETKNWVVAHNGVLNNYKNIIQEYIPDHNIDVDSSVIPAFMEYLLRNKPIKNNIELMDSVVKSVLNLLSGTYAVFIYNKPNNILYVARAGCTLYYDKNNIKFSSICTPDLEQFPDYTLYKREQDKFEKIANLKNNSSFIIF